MSSDVHRRLGVRAGSGGLAALIVGAVPLELLNHCTASCHIGTSLGIGLTCGSLFLMLAGFMTTASAIARASVRTYLVVSSTTLAVAAAGLTWFALTFNPLF